MIAPPQRRPETAPPSLRAHVLALVQRLALKRRLDPAAPVARLRFVLGHSGMPTPRDVDFSTASLGDVGIERARRRGAPPGLPLLYLHGGGFVASSVRTYRPLTGALARRGFDVVVPKFRRPPEHPFPAALEDAVAAWAALAAQGPAVVAGDSAGGNLVLGAMLAARDRGLPMPARAALFSPWLDLTCSGASMRENDRRDTMLSEALMRRFAELYLAGADSAQAAASPLFADLAGLPPLLVHAGQREVLRDDAVRLAERCRAAGVPAALTLFPAVPHGWQFADRLMPEARRSLDLAAAFLKGG